MNTLAKLLSLYARATSETGDTSATRVLVLSTAPFVILLPVVAWFELSMISARLLEYPGSIIGAQGALLSAVFGWSHFNKREETKESAP
jgi:hypothetical protein